MILRNIFTMSLFLVFYTQNFLCLGAQKSKLETRIDKDFLSHLPFTFVPPQKWQCISEREGLPTKVEAVYIGNGTNGFNPSINIATEDTNLNLADYVKMAKVYHERQPQTKCHLLGSYVCQAGNMELLQIEQSTSWGIVNFLQAAFIKDQKAYVITATCLEKEYSEYYPKFLQSLQTFNINAPPKIEGKDNND